MFSQGSVATRLRSGGIADDHLIINLLRSLPVKKCENQSIVGDVIDKSIQCLFFDSPCTK